MIVSAEVKCPGCGNNIEVKALLRAGEKSMTGERRCQCGAEILIRADRQGKVRILDSQKPIEESSDES